MSEEGDQRPHPRVSVGNRTPEGGRGRHDSIDTLRKYSSLVSEVEGLRGWEFGQAYPGSRVGTHVGAPPAGSPPAGVYISDISQLKGNNFTRFSKEVFHNPGFTSPFPDPGFSSVSDSGTGKACPSPAEKDLQASAPRGFAPPCSQA